MLPVWVRTVTKSTRTLSRMPAVKTGFFSMKGTSSSSKHVLCRGGHGLDLGDDNDFEAFSQQNFSLNNDIVRKA